MMKKGTQKQFVHYTRYEVKGPAGLSKTLIFAGKFRDRGFEFLVFRDPKKKSRW
ncbi:MAG: hypothetical protein L6R43_04620 [Planctomycetes bacterium]|nr:hypothetical protein [Planctomycetota bacterium]